MASISPYPNKQNRDRWRVSYTIVVGGRKIRKQKYAKLRADAELLRARLMDLERATRQGYAPEKEIGQWVETGWIEELEAKKAFRYYEDLLEQKRIFQPRETDYQKIYDRFYEWSANTSKDGLRGKTHVSRMGYTRRILGWLRGNFPRLEELRPSHVERYIEELTRTHAPSTIHQTLTILRQYLDTAIQLGMIAQNPAREVSPSRVKKTAAKRILTLAEVDRIKGITAKPRYHTLLAGAMPVIVHLGLYAGLRNNEMCWVRWDQIDFDNRIIDVGKSVCEVSGIAHVPKDHELRRIDVKRELIDFFIQERGRQQKNDLLGDFVIPNRRGNRPIMPDSLAQAFGRMMQREIAWSGENGEDPPDSAITIYCMRHSYATWALRSGIDIETLRRRLGHADLKTTMEYLHYIAPEDHPMDNLPY